MANLPVSIVYGTANWKLTSPATERQQEVIDVLRRHGIDTIDTATLYQNEEYLGSLGLPNEFKIITKTPGGFGGPNGASREAIFHTAAASFAALKVEKVYIYYLHAQDSTTPIEETMDAIQVLYKAGRFERFGLSNVDEPLVRGIHAYATSKGYILPTIYQANYNLLGRKNEKLLFPTLRELGIAIQAYSPIAGGFLAKTPELIKNPESNGRWNPTGGLGSMYHVLYNNPSFLQYLGEYEKLANEAGLGKVEMAYRWVMFNSMLDGSKGDGLVVGASRASQLEETLEVLQKGPLEQWVVSKLDEMWQSVEKDAAVDNFKVYESMGGN